MALIKCFFLFCLLCTGASIPSEAMMHSPCFRFPPYFRKNVQILKFFHNFTFFRKISRFSSAKISDYLSLVIDHKFRIFTPIFPASVHFPPVLRKLLFPLCFYNFPALFSKNSRVFYILYVYFVPPLLRP